ncbi:hypothetical protein [Flavobacteriaceae bacterium 14752]|uniref:hypothetical protein n=1 Tax=Mesohalobacter salilacus TaxID=2491711 RepID=UPI000F640E5F|nr:hypothetical protein EIG84_12065 [Flavobacteriaceae bacterium 14752]
MKFYKLIKPLLLCFGILFVVSCEDELKEISNQQIDNNYNVNIDMQYKKLNELIKDNKFVRQNIESFKTKDLTSSSIYNFSFVDDDVMILYGDSIDQFTFPIVRDTVNPNYFENYILRQNHNGDYQQYLIKYKKVNQTAFPISHQSITDTTIVKSCMPQVIGTETIEYDCNFIDDNEGQLTGCPGVGHPDHNDCMNGSVECSYLTVFIYDDNCGGSGNDASSGVDTNGPDTNGDSGWPSGTCCNTDDGNVDLDGDDFVGHPVSSPKGMLSQSGTAFLNNLPQTQQDWFNSLLDCDDLSFNSASNCNKDLAEDIMFFFNSVDAENTAEAQAFFDVAVQELQNNPDAEVDWEEIIINTLTGKADCVLNKIQNSSGNTIKGFLNNFLGSNPVSHLKFSLNSNLPSNINAQTNPPNNFIIEIQINSNNIPNRPTLMVARTFYHEIIHAEMFRKLLSIANNGGDLNGLTIQQLNNMLSNGDFPGILQFYTQFGANGFQHEQMAAHYIDILATALADFDNNQHSMQFYRDISWVGLKNTQAWSNLNQLDKNRINNTITNFNQNGNTTC